MTKHVHAEMMALYAEDAMQTAEPWARWEMSSEGVRWDSCLWSPGWAPNRQYRRKARTITIEGVTLPAPETEAPVRGTNVFVPCLFDCAVIGYRWGHECGDHHKALKNGQIFLHRDHAQQWADFIVSIMTRGRE